MENPDFAGLKFKSPEEEINFLREQISQKEKALSERNFTVEKDTVVAEQVSRYRDMPVESVLHQDYSLSTAGLEAVVLNLAPEEHDKKIAELVGIRQEKGLKNTLSVLAGMRDPHLEDDFHRFLVQYIQKGYEPKDFAKKDEEFRGVGMTLYELVLPEDRSDENKKPLKEIISSMEQFFSGMLSVVTKENKNNYIVLEIANPNGSDQFIFFVAVPTDFKDLFEEQVISVFYNARLTEMTGDYNIFNEQGVSLGSYLTTKEKPVYPFKTYEQFDHDPMNVILNSFSKIQKTGEGAALQFIFLPSGDYFHKRYQYAVKEIEKGVKTKDAIDLPESFLGEMGKGFKEFFSPVEKKDKEKEAPKPIDSEAIRKIEQKISTTIVATNVRLVVSARDQISAERILHGIESSFNQFDLTTSNSLVWKRQKGNDLQKLFRDFSFRVYEGDQMLPLNLRELSTLVHFNNTNLNHCHHIINGLTCCILAIHRNNM